MSIRRWWYQFDFFLSRSLSPSVKYILLINCLFFLIQIIILPLAGRFTELRFYNIFAEQPSQAIYRLALWQFVTYMFIHANTLHFLFNMLILWFFAPRLEYRWGTIQFTKFYLVVGIGAGLFHAVISLIVGRPDERIIGASGALYGILLAFALYWPNDLVWVWGVFPIKVKYLMIILGLMAFFGSVNPDGSRISHITHLGGLIVAFLYLWLTRLWRPPSHRSGFSRFSFYDDY